MILPLPSIIIAAILWASSAVLWWLARVKLGKFVYGSEVLAPGWLESEVSDLGLAFAPTAEEGHLIARPVKVICPEKMAVGQSASFEVHFPVKPSELKGAEEAGDAVLSFMAREEEPLVEVQLLAADFDVKPEGGKQIVRLRRGRAAKAIFNISPRSEGDKTVDVLISYEGDVVVHITRRIKVVSYVFDKATASKLKTLECIDTILGIISVLIGFLLGKVGI